MAAHGRRKQVRLATLLSWHTAQRRRADAARDSGDWDAAALHYRRFLRTRPWDAAAWVQLGHAEKQRGRLQAARRAYQAACRIRPTAVDPALQLGHACKLAGDDAAACAAYARALQSDKAGTRRRLPTWRDHRGLGDAARTIGDWAAAAEHYAAHLQRQVDDAEIWVQLGHAERERTRLDAACNAYGEALRLATTDPMVRAHLDAVLRLLAPPAEPDGGPPPPPPLDDYIVAAIGPYFDPAFYRANGPDLAEFDGDLLAHYHRQGWREGRDPSRSFSVRYYLAMNGDVAEADMDPLLHWVWAGRTEGRRANRPLDAERAVLERATSPQARRSEWAAAADHSAPLAPDDLLARLRGSAGLFLSVSHDDYARHSGGVQNTIGDEQRGVTARGWRYLHLSPAAPLPMLADDEGGGLRLHLRLDGAALGVARVADLADALLACRAQGTPIRVSIHHLLGHAPEQVAALVRAAGDEAPTLWLHDFFSLCSSYALMRNDVVHCGAPAPHSTACRLCCYGADRPTHLARMRAFFAATRPAVLAPSEATRDLWLARAEVPHAGVAVQGLADLALVLPRGVAPVADRPLRIGHLGARKLHKGWPDFMRLALRFANDPRYEFFQLGTDEGEPRPDLIRHIPVQVGMEHRDAMVAAIAENGIDVAVLWSQWPETFCFTVHEALAGGAFVLVRDGAGNIGPALMRHAPDQGCVLPDADALMALLEGPRLLSLAAKPRRRGQVWPGSGIANALPRLEHGQGPSGPHRIPPQRHG